MEQRIDFDLKCNNAPWEADLRKVEQLRARMSAMEAEQRRAEEEAEQINQARLRKIAAQQRAQREGRQGHGAA